MKNSVASIVVTYNRINILKECIEALRDQTYKNHSIIVVDNGSTDLTDEWLKTQKDLIVISQDNLGGAGGFFTGIKYACEHGYERSWIMDDDVIPDKCALEKLYNASLLVEGFVCSNVLDMSGMPCNVPRVSNKKSKKTGEPLWGALLKNNMLGVDIASFVSVLFKNSIVYEIGLPFKEYFIWGDDTEYTSRISQKYPSYMVIDSFILHKRQMQSALSIFTEQNNNRISMYFYAYRNRIHNQRTFYRKFLMFLYSLLQSIQLTVIGKRRQSRIVLKGLLASLSFNPTIRFPDKRES